MEKFRSAETLKSNVVNNLRDVDKWTLFLQNSYLYEMSLEETYGVKITLRAIANFFNVKVVVISTLGERDGANILP